MDESPRNTGRTPLGRSCLVRSARSRGRTPNTWGGRRTLTLCFEKGGGLVTVGGNKGPGRLKTVVGPSRVTEG